MSSTTLSNVFSTRNRIFAAGAVAVIGMGGLLASYSDAAFSGTTSNEGNTWNAATVSLVNDRASAAFVAENITPGYTESKCITVTSTSSVPVVVKTYSADLVAGPLSDALQVNIVEGSQGTNTDDINTGRGACTGFVADGPAIFAGSLASFGAITDYAAGRGNALLQPAGSKQYMITASLPSNAPDTLQASGTGITLVWEGQNN